MKELQPVNLENLTNLLNRIWSDELNHRQNYYRYKEGDNCEAACCLAGWDFALNYNDEKFTEYYLENDIIDEFSENKFDFSEIGNIWKWSEIHNNLTSSEGTLLFNSFATKYMHKLVLNAFKEGKRLNLEYKFIDIDFNNQDYENGSVKILVEDSSSYKSVLDFLGKANIDNKKIEIEIID